MVFMNEKLTLWDAASSLKKKDYRFFNPRGVEFGMFVITLAMLSLPLLMLPFTLYSDIEAMRIVSLWVAGAVIIATWVIEIVSYRHYLLKREEEFPDKSWCIIKRA
jgi:hypothetical protein